MAKYDYLYELFIYVLVYLILLYLHTIRSLSSSLSIQWVYLFSDGM